MRQEKSGTLLHFGRGDEKFTAYTIDHDLENVAVFGGTGSGKSSGPDFSLTVARMLHGYGILSSLPKPGSGEQLKGWAQHAGRLNNFRLIQTDGQSSFPLFDYLAKQGGGKQAVIRRAVDMLTEVNEISGRGRMSDSSGDAKFFTQSASRLSHDAMNVDLEGNGSIDADRCLQMIQTIPETLEAAQNKDGFCRQQCAKALERCSLERLPEVRKSVNYLMVELAALDPRPKGSIVASATVLWSELANWPLSALFGKDSGISPDDVLKGAIYGINLPLSMGGVAVTAFVLWKNCVQLAVLGRQDTSRPVNILLQEASQYLSTSDHAFVAMCREARGCMHLSMQSVAGALVTIPKEHLDGILANCNCRIYCQNDCPLTNEMASLDFGEHEVLQKGAGYKAGEWEPFAGEMAQDVSFNVSVQRKRLVPPEEFKYLRRGGGNPPLVETRVRTLNREYGMTGFRSFFDQNCPLKRSWFDRWKNPDVVTLG